MLCLVKTIFFLLNYQPNNGWEINTASEGFTILLWSLYYDAVCVALVSLPFFIVSLLPVKKKLILAVAGLFSTCLGALAILLNLADIFYFPFHRQRADADLLYVLRNPFKDSSLSVWMIIAGIVFTFLLSFIYLWKQHKKMVAEKLSGTRFLITTFILLLIFASIFTGHSKKMIPTRPLTDIKAIPLPLVQNSFHTFLYSIYRSRESVIPSAEYMPYSEQEAIFPISKKNINTAAVPKNIVLFIMESVPYEFFDPASGYKPVLPFLDSLLDHAVYYSNAFSYSYNSNKGITAILTGIPTITDIPLYHSGFTGIDKTSVGTSLQQKNYYSSFFIGDHYDDFGFAKCCNWTGIRDYYCMQDIPGYRQLEKHPLGLHDEYVLDFMQQKLQQTSQPFFAAQYNISTHYPNDLPVAWQKKLAPLRLPAPMKSMMYYDECLRRFFKDAAAQPWFKNSVFIFCSDHWANPGAAVPHDDIVNSFRIPVFIYDPAVNKKEIKANTVSQLDIMNTILAYAGIKEPVISYGESLLDAPADSNRVVFTKINNSVYEAINKDYVLGFNADEGKTLYCYLYVTDPKRKNNLAGEKNSSVDSLQTNMKAFLQAASRHYRNKK